MELVRRINLMREMSREARGKGKKIALVPTMGALHDGHLSLVHRARDMADLVVVSVFVNPKQFGPHEDFGRYPRDLARDTDLCIQEGVDILFVPESDEMYPASFRTFIEVEGLSSVLEGASRPGHFRGVATVVLKLLNIVRPHLAVFGQKDAQQVQVLRRMIRDLNVDVEMIVQPTLRHEDGLAMSSRNAYLAPEDREAAAILHRTLEHGRDLIQRGEVKDHRQLEAEMRHFLEKEPRVALDYVMVVNPETLEPPATLEGDLLIPIAATIGTTRLIDNIQVRKIKVPSRPQTGGGL